MKLKQVTIYIVEMQMKQPFTTSFGTVQNKRFLVVEAEDTSGVIGWGEGVAFEAPSYTEETMKTSLHMLEDFLIPMLLHKELQHPDKVNELFTPIRRNMMAKAAIEGAVWDLYARLTNQSLAEALGGTREKVEVGVSIGLQPTYEQLYAKIDAALAQGYKRIKVKIKPGEDVSLIRAIREKYPDVPLMADANSAYTLQDIELLKALDEFQLLMIEQPLAYDDLIEHAKLQQQIKTPICLDESITSLADAKRAVELGSCKIINLKLARVGGLTEAKRIHDYCSEHGMMIWCGGMLEAGIGRAQAVALSSLANFTLPGDTAASSNYWTQDIISPEVTVEDGYIHVSKRHGIGYEVDKDVLGQYCLECRVYN
ncbi:MAG: o-succinylbenzoate synthase [Solibacillus sp.]